MRPVMKMDVMSWELDYDNAITDETGKVLNISEFAIKYSADFIIRRCPRFYLKDGDLYLASSESKPPQCETWRDPYDP